MAGIVGNRHWIFRRGRSLEDINGYLVGDRLFGHGLPVTMEKEGRVLEVAFFSEPFRPAVILMMLNKNGQIGQECGHLLTKCSAKIQLHAYMGVEILP